MTATQTVALIFCCGVPSLACLYLLATGALDTRRINRARIDLETAWDEAVRIANATHEPPLYAATIAAHPEVTAQSVVAEAEAVLRSAGGGS